MGWANSLGNASSDVDCACGLALKLSAKSNRSGMLPTFRAVELSYFLSVKSILQGH